MSKKSQKKTKKVNNSGFSLIEVLVAVIILALVAGPILMAFVMSARFNARARESQRLSAAAESVMEEFKGFGVNPTSAYQDITSPTAPAGSKTFGRANVLIDNNRYDVKVTVNEIRDKEAVTLNGAETAKDTVINTRAMNAYYDYLYSQDVYLDMQIYTIILNNVYTYLVEDRGMADLNMEDLSKSRIKADRVVSLSVTGDGSAQNVSLSFTYNYKIENYPNPGHGNINHTFPAIVVGAVSDEGLPIIETKTYKELKNVYLFYSPGYSNSLANTVAQFSSDTINVNNSTGLSINADVVKQDNPLYVNRTTLDNAYFPTFNSSGVTLATYIKSGDDAKVLNPHAEQYLMYSVTVEVYEAGAKNVNFPGTALYTLEGSTNTKEING